MVLVVVVLGLGGLVVGSFLTVVIPRIPRGESLRAPSGCPHCGRRIRTADRIPLLGWIVLRSRCRDCRERISWRYPAIEGGTGLAFALVTWWWFLARSPSHRSVAAAIVELVLLLFLAAVSIALAVIDLDVRRLPNAIVYPAYAVVGVLLAVVALLDADGGEALRAAIGGAGLFVLYLLLALAYPAGMGLGDVKLSGLLGLVLAFVGWGALAVGALAPFLLGGVFGLLLLITRRAGRRTRIPFGPWLLAGAWIGLVAGGTLAASYLALFGLG